MISFRAFRLFWAAIALAISSVGAFFWIANRGASETASPPLIFEQPERPSLDPLAASVYYANAFRRQLSKGDSIDISGSHLTPGSQPGQTRSPDWAFLVESGFLSKQAITESTWRIVIDVAHECLPYSVCQAKAVAILLADGHPIRSAVAFDRNTVAPTDPIFYFTPKGFSSISGLADFSNGR